MYDLHQAVLAALVRGRGYPTEVIERIVEASEGHLHPNAHFIHPVLWELERKGLVSAEWGEPDPRYIVRPGRYYSITAEGHKALVGVVPEI